jgi:hypothetical protein
MRGNETNRGGISEFRRVRESFGIYRLRMIRNLGILSFSCERGFVICRMEEN